jgi:ferrous iron transport protein B
LGGGVKELIECARHLKSAKKSVNNIPHWDPEEFQRQHQELSEIHQRCFTMDKKLLSQNRTAKIDHWLLNPYIGPFIFVATMFLLFVSIFWLADPIMGWIDESFAALASWVHAVGNESLFADFLGNGIVAGFGAFLVFTPQIFILFLGLNLLEDSGYLARAATIIDKPFTLIGLNGRSFAPLLSGHACAVPAMMAARTIPNKRERWLTLMILPLMTCSARLPVYALLLAFLFDSALTGALWLTIIYFSTFILGGVATAIASQFIKNNEGSFFLLELPQYRRPRLMTVLKSAFDKTKSFVLRAGPIIFFLSIAIWTGTTFPNFEIKEDSTRLESSYFGQTGKYIQPIMEPLGLDWKSGIGIVTSIAAREVFVSTLALVYNVADDDEDRLQTSLLNAMRNSKHSDGRAIFTTASVAALIVFYMIALQCIATVGVAKKESGSWSFALGQLIFYNVAAYIAALITYQVLV